MDFSFTEEQKAIMAMCRDFAKKELLPKYAYWDRTGEFPGDLIKKMGDLGLLGLRIPAEYGGQILDYLTVGLVVYEIARGDFSVANPIIAYAIVAEIIALHGTEEIKKEWLPLLASGDKIPTLLVTEPGCGSDVGAIKAKAIRKGDYYVLNGEKSGITLMMAADVGVVFAKTDPDAGVKGISAFVLPLALEGLERQSYKDMGSKGLARGSLFMDDVQIPSTYLLGKEGKGFYQVMTGFDFSRVFLALASLGAAEITLEETMGYVKERTAFGQPIAKFEGVSFPIAEYATLINAAKLLCYQALWLRDQGLPHTKEVAMAKWFGPKIAVEAVHECLLLHGHYGYTQEFPIEQRLRDVIALEIGDGTPQIQKIIISRELLGKEYLPY